MGRGWAGMPASGPQASPRENACAVCNMLCRYCQPPRSDAQWEVLSCLWSLLVSVCFMYIPEMPLLSLPLVSVPQWKGGRKSLHRAVVEGIQPRLQNVQFPRVTHTGTETLEMRRHKVPVSSWCW